MHHFRGASGVRGLRRGSGVGQSDHHLDVVRDDVVHLPRNACPLRRGGERRLLVPLDLQALGPLAQPVELAPQGAHDDAGQQGGKGQTGEEDERLEVVAGRPPAHGRHHDAGLEDDRGGNDLDPLGLHGDGVDGDQERGVGQGGLRHQPLDERHGGNDQEHGHGGPAAEHQREGQRGDQPQVGVAPPASVSQPEHSTNSAAASAMST